MAKRRRGLGSLGVDALLSDTTRAAISPADAPPSGPREFAYIGIEKIRPSRYQPRLHIDEAALQELTDSIREQGLIQPLAVRRLKDRPDRYELIAGERRWRAAQRLGLEEVPAVVREVEEQQAALQALVENIQRADLNPLEEAVAMHNTAESFELTHQQLADQVGRSRSAVSNLLRLLELDERVQQMLGDGRLDMGHARTLLQLEKRKQAEAAQTVADRKMSVRQTEAYVRGLLSRKDRAGSEDGNAGRSRQAAEITALERELETRLGTPVQISHKKRGSGTLIISYSDLDVLDGILSRIR